MRRFRNHGDFREEVGKLRARFEKEKDHTFDRLQQVVAAARPQRGPTRWTPEDLLEAHARTYLIDGFLHALNWNISFTDEPLTLAPELPVKAGEEGETKFLDYLGFQSETKAPLLIVEAKRPSASLPRAAATAQCDQNARLRKIVAGGLRGGNIPGPWPRWLGQLRTYCCCLEAAGPRSVCITNGDWLIIFTDPRNAFLAGGPVDQDQIYVYESFREVDRRSDEVFRFLEYHSLAQDLPEFVPGDLPPLLRGCSSASTIHAVQVDYNEATHGYGQAPVVYITPLLFIKVPASGWLRLGSGAEPFQLPNGRDPQRLNEHLEQVERAAMQLFADAAHQLGFQPDVIDLTDYGPELEGLPYVTERPIDSPTHHEFIVVTGRCTHFLRRCRSVPGCRFHSWANGKISGHHAGHAALYHASVEQRAFFSDGMDHHCPHRDVLAAKNPHALLSDALGLPRSFGSASGPFCMIWGFERRLCCRSCVFEEVCEAAPSFNLPCRRP